MAGEDDVRALVGRDTLEQRDAFLRHLDAAGRIGPWVEIEQLVEEDIFRAEPGHVAPHVEGDGFDLGLALFGIGVAQIFQCQPMAAGQRTDAAGDTTGEVERAVRRQQAQHRHDADGKFRHKPVSDPAKAQGGAELQLTPPVAGRTGGQGEKSLSRR
jgi:hypothetical protein